MEMHQKAHNRRLLRPWRRRPGAGQPLPRFDDIRHTDTEPAGHCSGATLRGKHPVTQILRVSLSTPPTHRDLRRLPEAYESQIRAVPEALFAILPLPAPL
jgi:hypothetical protein